MHWKGGAAHVETLLQNPFPANAIGWLHGRMAKFLETVHSLASPFEENFWVGSAEMAK